MNTKTGEIIEDKGSPGPQSNRFTIKGDDGETYFAHIGDFQVNEDLVYQQNRNTLKTGDRVKFKIGPTLPHAINVEKE